MTTQALGNTGSQDNTASSPLLKQFVSEAEYWEKYYDYPDKSYEWHNGYLEERTASNHITYSTYLWYLELANYYLDTHPIAETTGLGMGFRLVCQMR
jgi:hypothetical protein